MATIENQSKRLATSRICVTGKKLYIALCGNMPLVIYSWCEYLRKQIALKHNYSLTYGSLRCVYKEASVNSRLVNLLSTGLGQQILLPFNIVPDNK
jgi:hypothetical protein